MCIISQYIWILKFCLIYPISQFYFHWLYCIAQLLRHVQLFATPGIVAHQAPLPMEFSRQEHFSGIPFPTPGNLPDSGIKPESLASPILAGGSLLLGSLGCLIYPISPFYFHWTQILLSDIRVVTSIFYCFNWSDLAAAAFGLFSFTVWEIYLNVHTSVFI